MMDILAQVGVLAAADVPGSARCLSRLAATGAVVRLLPGIYAVAAIADRVEVRCQAIMLWDPDAVITGLAAARLSWWKDASVTTIEFHSVRKKWAPKGFRLHRSRVPEEDIVELGGVRVARVAWVAAHLAHSDHGATIDAALRITRLTLDALWQAFARGRGRHGNPVRRKMLQDSRDEPWSPGERWLHRVLRAAGLAGWVTNLEVRLPSGVRFLDVAFRGARVAIEFDGREFHGPGQFEKDRQRQNQLVAAGWRLLRVTWQMLDNPAEFLAQLKTMLRGQRSVVV